MIDFLKNHPFAVEAHFEKSIVLTYATPKEELLNFIPVGLSLDTFQDKWAFIAVALVKTKNLRPKGFPSILGKDFYLIGYRIFVRYKTVSGKNLRGLYILKSETDKKQMTFLGNILTHYNYSTTDISEVNKENTNTIFSANSNFKISIDSSEKEAGLPAESCFSDWKDARKFAGPLPHTFSVDPKNKAVLIVEGVRENWTPKPIEIKEHYFEYINSLHLKNVVLANAFQIENIPYYWKKGRIEKWR
jgi:uncharacterized protein YqjF (DUF2071 family)